VTRIQAKITAAQTKFKHVDRSFKSTADAHLDTRSFAGAEVYQAQELQLLLDVEIEKTAELSDAFKVRHDRLADKIDELSRHTHALPY
jgi:hypothetical protein